MINLLPPQFQKTQNAAYRLRYLSLICAIVFVLSAISLAFFAPAYILTGVRADLTQANKTADSGGPTETEVSAALTELSRTALLAVEIGGRLPTSNVFETLHALELKPKSVRINEILYVNRAGQEIVITMRGVAADREALKSFSEFLTVRPEFEKVDLPISNFAKENNIDFSLNASVVRTLGSKN